jgi:hypothetical protein
MPVQKTSANKNAVVFLMVAVEWMYKVQLCRGHFKIEIAAIGFTRIKEPKIARRAG